MQRLDRPVTPGSLIRFSLPTVLSMVLMSIYTTVDGIFVARLVGTNALGAVNITMPLVMTGVALATMFGTGGNAICARLLGEGKPREARGLFSAFTLVFFLLIAALCAVSLVFLDPLLRAMGASDLLMADCRAYARWTLILGPLSMPGCMFQSFHITNGRASLAMWLSVAGGVTNIVLDYVFIRTLGWGIAGAAVATGMGYLISSCVGGWIFFRDRRAALHFTKPLWSSKALLHCCGNGSSEMVTNLAISIVTILFNQIMMRLAGEDGVAAVTIILYAQGLFTGVLMGYAMGVAPLISFHYGRGDGESQRRIFRSSIRLILTVSVATMLLSFLCARPLTAVFAGDNAAVTAMAVRGFRIFAVNFLFCGISIYGSSMFTAYGNGLVSALISMLRTLVFVVAALLTLPALLELDGVWLAVPLAEALGAGVTVYFLITCRRRYAYLSPRRTGDSGGEHVV